MTALDSPRPRSMIRNGAVYGAGLAMPIRGMLDSGVFGPHEIAEMVAAFEATLAELRLVDRTDPVTQLVAKIIIDCAKTGEIERVRLRDCAIEAVTKH